MEAKVTNSNEMQKQGGNISAPNRTTYRKREISHRLSKVSMIVIAIFLLKGTIFGMTQSSKVKKSITKSDIQQIKIKTVENIKIKNGINYIDLNGDGKKDMVVSGHRQHINVHSFDVYSFYIYNKVFTYEWQIVEREEKDSAEKAWETGYIIHTSKGEEEGECEWGRGSLRDIRLVKFNDENSYYLVIAQKPHGYYVEKEKIIFSFYKLFYNSDEKRFIYKKSKEIKSINEYPDVDKAFKKELGY